MLKSLEAAGVLNDVGTTRQLRSELQSATEVHSKTMTPYGPVVQTMRLNHPRLKDWDICNPFAWLYHMSVISPQFASVMKDCSSRGPLRVVIYADEMIPGNPFRPEKSRTLMCIYWSIVDWPSFLLTRTFAWPVFSIVRSVLFNDIDGGMSYIARCVLRTFFSDTGESFDKGIVLQSADGPYIVKGVFAGWLCDLMGHKEITEWMGPNGTITCLECHNVQRQRRGIAANGTVGLDCYDRTKWVRRTNVDVFAIIDDLVVAKTTLQKTPFKTRCTNVGWNLIPNGLLLDMYLRTIYKPVEHTIRDWQHTFCQDGVANSAIAAVLHAIADHGFSLDHVRSFSVLCNLPSKYGRVNPEWLGKNRLKKETLTSFSGIVLTLIPIIWLFLDKFCIDIRELDTFVRMHKLLHVIVGVLATGPESAPRHVDRLRSTLTEFHALADQCFRLKPKIHHMHHVLDGMMWLGKLLSCFVTERKHRLVKDCALHVMRHIEHTVLADVVNTQCVQMTDGTTLWQEFSLVNPKTIDVALYTNVKCSTQAIITFGFARQGDLIWCKGSRCCRLRSFYETTVAVFAAVCFLRNNDGGALCMFHEDASIVEFIDCREFIDAVMWYRDSPGIIKVVIPPIVLIG